MTTLTPTLTTPDALHLQLNAQQYQAVTHTEGPLLIVAGPGSGKTRVITHRIAHILSTGLAPAPAILAVTFTNKAAREMRERVSRLVDESMSAISTFHSFAVRFLRRDGFSLAEIRPGFTSRFLIYDKPAQKTLLSGCYWDLGLDKDGLDYDDVLGVISEAKNEKQDPKTFLTNAQSSWMKTVGRIYAAYEDALLRENALDFDDLVGDAVRLLHHDAATRRILNERFKYIMVDEFQDTNKVQYELIRLLTGSHDNICVVGDDDQGIYSWRGAKGVENIARFKQDHRKVEIVHLEQNYRSTKTIVAASKALIERNPTHQDKQLWTDNPHGQPVLSCALASVDEEANYIALTIARNRQPPAFEGRIAILYRSNRQSLKIELALRRYGLPYRVVKGLSFFKRAEIQDIIAYLRLASGSVDYVSMLRVFKMPTPCNCRIGKKGIEVILQYAQEMDIDLWEACGRLTKTRECTSQLQSSLKALCGIITDLRAQAASLQLPELIGHILERTGYEKMLQSRPNNATEDRLGNVLELKDMASEAASRGEIVEDFLDSMALTSDGDDYDENALISLMTIHASKGLEFPVVYVSGLEDGLVPHSRSFESPEMMEEERRLFYVAMTRAQKLLILTRSSTRMHYGQEMWASTSPSRFLRDLPEHLLFQQRQSFTSGND